MISIHSECFNFHTDLAFSFRYLLIKDVHSVWPRQRNRSKNKYVFFNTVLLDAHLCEFVCVLCVNVRFSVVIYVLVCTLYIFWALHINLMFVIIRERIYKWKYLNINLFIWNRQTFDSKITKNLTNDIFSIWNRHYFYRIAKKNFKQKFEHVDPLTPDFHGIDKSKCFHRS